MRYIIPSANTQCGSRKENFSNTKRMVVLRPSKQQPKPQLAPSHHQTGIAKSSNHLLVHFSMGLLSCDMSFKSLARSVSSSLSLPLFLSPFFVGRLNDNRNVSWKWSGQWVRSFWRIPWRTISVQWWDGKPSSFFNWSLRQLCSNCGFSKHYLVFNQNFHLIKLSWKCLEIISTTTVSFPSKGRFNHRECL